MFHMRRILIIGATGNIGRRVAAQLAASGAPVRAMTRNPAAAELPPGIDLVQGDLTQPETLDRCLEGIDTVFLVWVAAASAVAPALERIARYGRRIVFLSAPYKTPHPFFQQRNPIRDLHASIEGVIEASGAAWTFLRPGMLASNALFWWAPQIRAGTPVRWPYLDVPTAPIDERDIAAVAVRALRDEGHAGAEYVLTGPESLTQLEQLKTIAGAIGRRFETQELSRDEALRDAFVPEPFGTMLLNAWAAGAGQPALVTSTVEAITGKPARTFFEWAKDHTAEFGRIPGAGASRLVSLK